MSVYIISFAISTFLMIKSSKQQEIQKKICVIIALLIPCLVAGFRASCIGTDTQGYLWPMFQAAIKAKSLKEYMSSSWFYIWRDLYVKDYEIGFSMIVFVVGKIFGNIVPVQVVIQALTIIPIYYAINRNKDYPTWMGMVVYYSMFFNTTLNLMRQSIAMAFVFLAIQFLSEKEYQKYILFLFIGILFHKSAILGLAIGGIYILTTKKIELKYTKADSRNLIIVAIILLGIIALCNINYFVEFLSSIGFDKYINYINGSIVFMPNQIIIRLPIVILYIINWKIIIEEKDNFRFFVCMLCMDIICAQFTSVNIYSGRIALFFSQFSIIAFPVFYAKERYKNVNKIILWGYLLFYWAFFFVLKMQDSTIPYLTIWN